MTLVRRFFLSLCGMTLLAQTPAATVPNAVLATLTVRPGIQRAQVMKVLPEEVRATVKLYLDGKIQQWYSRGDGKGVVFILNCASVEEAKTVTGSLPLVRANLASFDYMPLAPLNPLRVLVSDSPQR